MAYDSGNRWSDNRSTAQRSAAQGSTVRTAMPEVGIDAGLREYMLRVYNYMAGGLALTGAIAYFAAASGFTVGLVHSGMMWLVVLAPLAIVLFLSFGIQTMSLGAAQAAFWAYAGLMGLFLSTLFLVYTHASIAQTFFVTAATFLAMSLYGYTTRSDLTRLGSFLFMGLIGIIIASVVGLFMNSPALQFAISIAGVIVFTGLTAWDTQRIKEMYWEGDGSVVAGKKAIMGALRLYLDFVNLFIMLLRLMGSQRN